MAPIAETGGTCLRTQGPAAGVAAQVIEVAGTPTALRRAGEGPPLMFLHGAGFTGAWLRFHEALSKGSDLLAPEHIGFGNTPMQDWMRSMDDMLVHYDDLVRVLGLERIDLVGYSLGGWIAARFAVLWPERVRSLTLIVPAGLRGCPGTPTPPDLFLMDPGQLADHLFEDRTNIDEVFAFPEGADPIDAAMKMYGQMSAVARLLWNPRQTAAAAAAAAHHLADAAGRRRERPAAAGRDTVGSYARLIPHAQTTRIPGTGHALIVEQPEAVAQAVLNFVKEAS